MEIKAIDLEKTGETIYYAVDVEIMINNETYETSAVVIKNYNANICSNDYEISIDNLDIIKTNETTERTTEKIEKAVKEAVINYIKNNTK